jgi:hypothetical protein
MLTAKLRGNEMVRMRNLSRRAVRLLAAGMAAWAVGAAGSTTAYARPLTIAVGSDVTSLDPHFHNTAINDATGDHIRLQQS